MSLLDRLLGRSSALAHPTLGPLRAVGRTTWTAERVEPFGSPGPTSLLLSGGEGGPDTASVETYQELRARYGTLKGRLEPVLFELNQNYFSEQPDEALSEPAGIWGTETLRSVEVAGAAEVSLTYSFDWQHPDDGHEVTVRLREWRVLGVSIDG